MTDQLIINNRQKGIGALVGLFVFFAAFFFMPGAVECKEDSLTSFGEGEVKVRLYSDYFCSPCRGMEPDIEPVISKLVRDKIITLIFVDTPFYRNSGLYVRYFLYAMNAKKDLETALFVRRSLIEAAKSMLDSEEKLQTFLKGKKIALKPFDPKPVFDILSRYMKEDDIQATPTCVIDLDGKKSKYLGAPDITKSLNQVKQRTSK